MVCVFCLGSLVDMYRKQCRLMETLDFFTTHEWHFSTENVRRLWSKLSAADQSTFPFDVSRMDWKSYMDSALAGTKTFLLKEGGGGDSAVDGVKQRRCRSVKTDSAANSNPETKD